MKKLLSSFAFVLFSSLIISCGSSESALQPLTSESNQVSQLSSNINKPVKNDSSIASFLRFDVKNPEVQNYIKSKGLDKKGYQINVNKADLVYTTDNWKTTLTSQKQYLIDNTEGFILRNVAPDTTIEYSVHTTLCLSYDHFYSCAQTEQFWVNNNGKNYQAKTSAK